MQITECINKKQERLLKIFKTPTTLNATRKKQPKQRRAQQSPVFPHTEQRQACSASLTTECVREKEKVKNHME